MAERTDVSGPVVCQGSQEPGCTGIKLDHGEQCLAHASDQDRYTALKEVSETGKIDARGVQISQQLLDEILDAAPRGENGRALFRSSQFDHAIFDGDIAFDGVNFEGDAWFRQAAFSGDAGFDNATFSGRAAFDGAAFSGDARFIEATFGGGATFFSGDATFNGAAFSGGAWFILASFSGHTWFTNATFSGIARFSEAIFSRRVWFDNATFSGRAAFRKATFSGDTRFSGATFSTIAQFGWATFRRHAIFDNATFSGHATFNEAAFFGDAGFSNVTFSGRAAFDEATFRRGAVFDGAKFEQVRQFGPVLAHRGLVLDNTDFMQPVQIEVSTTGLCCRQARFPGGAQLRLRWARVVLDGADFSAPSILTGIPRLSSQNLAAQEKPIAQAWQRLPEGEISERPQLLSLMQANVAGLALTNVTMTDCRFAGAHNLDKLRLLDVTFGLAHSPLGRLSWEGRQVIAEERDWRRDGRSRSWGWDESWWPAWLGHRPAVLVPAQIAGLYRALRKGREDIKDEPGAADFYYGEMEMRRRARQAADIKSPEREKRGKKRRRGRQATGSTTGSESRGRAERGVLTAYWLVSGYGLRSWRAITCLAAITALFAVAFHFAGFAKPPQPVSYWTSLLYSFRATLSLPDDNVQLTAWGQLLQGLLRLTGPVLLGLALLALRGRVKR
jgi:Pentapeptide repeats (9 copies)